MGHFQNKRNSSAYFQTQGNQHSDLQTYRQKKLHSMCDPHLFQGSSIVNRNKKIELLGNSK